MAITTIIITATRSGTPSTLVVNRGPAGTTGATGATGPAGSDANVTNSNVNTAISTNTSATRSALGLGVSALSNQDVSTTASPTFHIMTAIRFVNAALTIGSWAGAFRLGSGTQISGSSTTLYTGSPDVGLRRSDVGIWEINNGTAGTFSDLILRNLTSSGTVENTTPGNGIILTSPDGTRYLLTVANGGTLAITAA